MGSLIDNSNEPYPYPYRYYPDSLELFSLTGEDLLLRSNQWLIGDGDGNYLDIFFEIERGDSDREADVFKFWNTRAEYEAYAEAVKSQAAGTCTYSSGSDLL